jgi:hypothetical protein
MVGPFGILFIDKLLIFNFKSRPSKTKIAMCQTLHYKKLENNGG